MTVPDDLQDHEPRVSRSVPLKGIQRVVAQRMLESSQNTAHVSAFAEADAIALLALLEHVKQDEPAVTLTHLLVQMVARCLKATPRMNASLIDGNIVEFASINVCLAVSLPSDDLQLVVIRDASELSLRDIATVATSLRERALAGRLAAADVEGGTFTLSNYGNLRHVTWSTPIIPPGQTGVLGVARAAPRPWVDPVSGHLEVRPTLPLSLTYDHRVINGLPAGRFLDAFVDAVQHPQVD